MNFYFIIFITVLALLAGYLHYKCQYWQNKGVPQIRMNFIENVLRMKTIHRTEIVEDVYQQFRGRVRYAGSYIFTKPMLVILDLDLIKSILIKDFNKFADRFEYTGIFKNTVSDHLFVLNNERWRPMRIKVTPTFTSAKMKFMFPTLVAVARQLDDVFGTELAQTTDGVIELHDMMARYTTDVIGECVFGVECNSLKDPNVEFRRIGRIIFHPQLLSIRLRLFMSTYPVILRFLKLFNFKRYSSDIDVFIKRLVHDTVRVREEQHIQRNDFLNLLIEMKNSKDKNGLPLITIEEMAAQVFIFFAAGFETSSSNLASGLYELAKNQHVQDKLRAEIKSVLEKHNGELTYEAMMEMTYLDQVMTETLRKYPALSSITRFSTEEYRVPDTNLILEKGTRIFIPAKAIHYDPDIYDNPEEFRPERFNPEEVQKRHPQAFLGFGDGPRNCIGLRFARMQVRVGLITLLKSYRFSFCEKTPAEIEISEYSIVLVPKSKILLKAEKL